jgi:hypothetical protein
MGLRVFVFCFGAGRIVHLNRCRLLHLGDDRPEFLPLIGAEILA